MGHEWARELVAKKAWVMHVSTHVVGRVDRFYEGVEGDMSEDMSGKPVPGPVLEVHETEDRVHTLVAREDAFVALTDSETGFYSLVSAGMMGLIIEVMKAGADRKLDFAKARLLTLAVLDAQASALRASFPQGEVAF